MKFTVLVANMTQTKQGIEPLWWSRSALPNIFFHTVGVSKKNIFDQLSTAKVKCCAVMAAAFIIYIGKKMSVVCCQEPEEPQ